MRKITIDNSVRYVPKNEKPKERDSKTKTTKLVHFLQNKTKTKTEIEKNSLKM